MTVAHTIFATSTRITTHVSARFKFIEMDTALLRAYRLVWADLTLLLDTALIYYSRRGGMSATDDEELSLRGLGQGLSCLLQAEQHEEDELEGPLEDDVLDFSEDTTAIRQLLWQFTHGVVLEFVAEELSQYPFWAAKVNTVVSGKEKSLLSAVLNVADFFRYRLAQGGFRRLFEGSVPYLGASAILHHHHLQKSVVFFINMVKSQLPRKPSLNIQPNAFRPHPVSTSMKRRSGIKKKASRKNSISNVLGKVAVAAMVHPLLLLSVRMVSTSDLNGQNWVSAYFSLVTTQGISALYTGLRISGMLALLPFSPWYTMGIPETVLFRRMSGQGKDDSLGGSFSVIYDAVAGEGLLGLLSYGLLTFSQTLPGFATFAATRALLWLVCGTTIQREKQYKRRKEILEDLWPKSPHLPPFINSKN